MNALRTLAAFDFDDTLAEGDSFWPFLRYVAGDARASLALAEGLARVAINPEKGKLTWRTALKEFLVRRLLTGRRTEEFAAAAEKLRAARRWKTEIHQKFLRHAEAGHRLVILSGSLDVYLPALTADLPPHDLIGTKLEMKNGVATGALDGGHCVRAVKAARVADYLAAHGPFEETWGYGNAPHDLPMLELLQRRVIV